MKRVDKIKIWNRDKFICQYCGVKLNLDTATVDHVLARCLGGKSTDDNLKTSCWECNNKKSREENYKVGIYKMLKKIKRNEIIKKNS